MVTTIFITYILIAVINTWYLTSLLKFKKELVASGGGVKETHISIVLCMLIYLVDIMFVAITTSIT